MDDHTDYQPSGFRLAVFLAAVILFTAMFSLAVGRYIPTSDSPSAAQTPASHTHAP